MNTIIRQSAVALIIAMVSLAGYASVPDGVTTMFAVMGGKAEILMAGTGTATIDWGDGSAPDTVTLLSAVDMHLTDFLPYRRTFSKMTFRIIVIKGKNITHLDCGRLGLIDLDASKNTVTRFALPVTSIRKSILFEYNKKAGTKSGLNLQYREDILIISFLLFYS